MKLTEEPATGQTLKGFVHQTEIPFYPRRGAAAKGHKAEGDDITGLPCYSSQWAHF